MSWRVAKSLLKLRDQINQQFPNRNRASDGTIGDAAHAKDTSDHNPHVRDGNIGVVTALDITHDPANGVNANAIARALINSRDPRIKYVISNGQICSAKVQPWVWRKYTGKNAHTIHFHISVDAAKSLYDDERDWNFSIADADTPIPQPLLKIGSRGDSVTFVQKRVGATPDGIFGKQSENAVKAFQKMKGLTADGIVGANTWRELLK